MGNPDPVVLDRDVPSLRKVLVPLDVRQRLSLADGGLDVTSPYQNRATRDWGPVPWQRGGAYRPDQRTPRTSGRSGDCHGGPPGTGECHVELAVALGADVQSCGERFLLRGTEADSDNVPLATLRLVGGEAGYRAA
jgi:hypothetical protein